jgi:hypothetical protein
MLSWNRLEYFLNIKALFDYIIIALTLISILSENIFHFSVNGIIRIEGLVYISKVKSIKFEVIFICLISFYYYYFIAGFIRAKTN